jgi:hypothetical protein
MTIGVCSETRKRIRLSVAAYAYEIMDSPIMSDADFDKLANEIDVEESTDCAELDVFFLRHFDPSTGVWIHKHPALEGIRLLYDYFYNPDFISLEELGQIERLI